MTANKAYVFIAFFFSCFACRPLRRSRMDDLFPLVTSTPLKVDRPAPRTNSECPRSWCPIYFSFHLSPVNVQCIRRLDVGRTELRAIRRCVNDSTVVTLSTYTLRRHALCWMSSDPTGLISPLSNLHGPFRYMTRGFDSCVRQDMAFSQFERFYDGELTLIRSQGIPTDWHLTLQLLKHARQQISKVLLTMKYTLLFNIFSC